MGLERKMLRWLCILIEMIELFDCVDVGDFGEFGAGEFDEANGSCFHRFIYFDDVCEIVFVLGIGVFDHGNVFF